MPGLIIEGVTGAGKSQTLGALLALDPPGLRGAVVHREDATLGELMDEELRDPALTDEARCWRLHTLLDGLERAPRTPFVLERFHPTYYALMPRWALYAEIDARLLALGARLVMLELPEAAARARSIHRVDRAGTAWAAGMIAAYGSEDAAVGAVLASQAQRHACRALTALEVMVVETGARDWAGYAREIAEAWAR